MKDSLDQFKKPNSEKVKILSPQKKSYSVQTRI